MFWVRIDNRLVHGQIIEAWLPFTGAEELLVVQDEVASDMLRQEIMSLAIPSDVHIRFATVEGAIAAVKPDSTGQWPNMLVLFATCEDARRAHQGGLSFAELNVGNMHYAQGKRQLCAHINVDENDEQCLGYFVTSGVALDFRCVPADPVQVKLS